ncbi:MAG: hypothetical protein QXW30_08415 [Saccharolobus sp.]
MRKSRTLTMLLQTLAKKGVILPWDLTIKKGTSLERIRKMILDLNKINVFQIYGDITSSNFKIVLNDSFNFLTLNKRVKIIYDEDRSRTMIFRHHIITLKEIDKIEATSYWTLDHKNIPILRLFTPKRELGKILVDKVDKGYQRLYVKWVLDPPAKIGEGIIYGFRIKHKNYFTFNREETIAKYSEEEMMEGLQIPNPTMIAVLEIQFPKDYEFKDVKAERYDLVLVDGPQSSYYPIPKDRHKLFIEKNSITLKLIYPPIGHYFVAWKPAK